MDLGEKLATEIAEAKPQSYRIQSIIDINYFCSTTNVFLIISCVTTVNKIDRIYYKIKQMIMIKNHRVSHRVHNIGGVYFINVAIRRLSAQDAFEQMLLKVQKEILEADKNHTQVIPSHTYLNSRITSVPTQESSSCKCVAKCQCDDGNPTNAFCLYLHPEPCLPCGFFKSNKGVLLIVQFQSFFDKFFLVNFGKISLGTTVLKLSL